MTESTHTIDLRKRSTKTIAILVFLAGVATLVAVLPKPVPAQPTVTCAEVVLQELKDKQALERALRSQLAEAEGDDFLVELTRKQKAGASAN